MFFSSLRSNMLQHCLLFQKGFITAERKKRGEKKRWKKNCCPYWSVGLLTAIREGKNGESHWSSQREMMASLCTEKEWKRRTRRRQRLRNAFLNLTKKNFKSIKRKSLARSARLVVIFNNMTAAVDIVVVVVRVKWAKEKNNGWVGGQLHRIYNDIVCTHTHTRTSCKKDDGYKQGQNRGGADRMRKTGSNLVLVHVKTCQRVAWSVRRRLNVR